MLPKGKIVNHTELIDVNSNFNHRTGVFSLKKDSDNGVYKFEYSGYKTQDCGKDGQIMVFKNRDLVQLNKASDSNNSFMITGIFTLHLKKGDEVKLENFRDPCSIYISRERPFTFTGYKI